MEKQPFSNRIVESGAQDATSPPAPVHYSLSHAQLTPSLLPMSHGTRQVAPEPVPGELRKLNALVYDRFHGTLASITGLSRYYFIRSFRKEFGLPPHAYANQLRLIAAKRLLATGQGPADVASAVGLYDQSHLNRLFKKTYGITPGTYALAFDNQQNAEARTPKPDGHSQPHLHRSGPF